MLLMELRCIRPISISMHMRRKIIVKTPLSVISRREKDHSVRGIRR